VTIQDVTAITQDEEFEQQDGLRSHKTAAVRH
jgi:hypothetical protein